MKNKSILRILCGEDTNELIKKDIAMITQARYNRKQQTLIVTINNETYHYFNIPLFVYNAFAKSPSLDEYFSSNIEKVYPCEKVLDNV